MKKHTRIILFFILLYLILATTLLLPVFSISAIAETEGKFKSFIYVYLWEKGSSATNTGNKVKTNGHVECFLHKESGENIQIFSGNTHDGCLFKLVSYNSPNDWFFVRASTLKNNSASPEKTREQDFQLSAERSSKEIHIIF